MVQAMAPPIEKSQAPLKNTMVVENKPASSLVVSSGKALNGTAPPLCEKQVAQTHRKWQLPSECGRSVKI